MKKLTSGKVKVDSKARLDPGAACNNVLALATAAGLAT